MYRRLSLLSMLVSVIMAVMVYSGVDEYAKSGQFPWGTVAVSVGMFVFAIIFAMKASSNVDRFGNRKSERIVNRDWDAENRRRQLRERQAALRDTMGVR